MQIAFWSSIGGKNAVTSNMVGIGVMSALMYERRVLLLENHLHINNLKNALMETAGNQILREEELYYYNHIGMDQLIKRLHSNILSENMVAASALKFLNDKLYYIPQSNLNHKELFEFELNEVIDLFLKRTKTAAELTFLDTAGESNLTTKTILETADIVVVNISQNPQIIQHFFENYSSLISKAFFLIGNYSRDSKHNLLKIRKTYQIEKEKIAVIPYNVEFKDSLTLGTLIPFLLKNCDCKRDSENYYFIKELKKAVKLLMGLPIYMEQEKQLEETICLD